MVGWFEHNRIGWFLPTQSGIGFGATIIHFANSSFPEKTGAFEVREYTTFVRDYPATVWFNPHGSGYSPADWGYNGSMWVPDCLYGPMTYSLYNMYKGSWVGLFRNPAQRMIAMYMRKMKSRGYPLSMDSYITRAAGSVTRQLAGQANSETWTIRPYFATCHGMSAALNDIPPEPDIDFALKRLNEGFAFVGITEDYDLSVCLFHVMLGGQCMPVEFQFMERGIVGPYFTQTRFHWMEEFLQGNEDPDPYDRLLYERATETFWQNMFKFGVKRSICEVLCPATWRYSDSPFSIHNETGRWVAPWKTRDYSWKSMNNLTGRADDTMEYDWPGRMYLTDDFL